MFNPKFLKRNKITSTSMITTSHANTDSQKLKLIDRNSEQYWQSVSGTSGDRTILITFNTAQTINRIFCQGVNWAGFTITYNGGTHFSESINVAVNSEANLYFEFDSVSASTVLITCSNTITAGATMQCGELYIGEEIFEMAAGTAGLYLVSPQTEQRILRLSDGTGYKIYVRRTTDFDIDLELVTEAERLNYLALYERNRREPFVFIPFAKKPSIMGASMEFSFTFPATFTITDDSYGQWDGVAGHYNWINPFEVENYAQNIRDNAVYRGTIKLMQAGGL